MPKRSRKSPADMNSLAASIVAHVTDEQETAKDPAAVALGRKGGKVGGKRRAENMTPDERSAAAKKAAEARWNR